MSDGKVGLESVPDSDLQEWLGERLDKADESFEKLIQDFIEIVEYGQSEGEPYLWSYARLLNFLATLDQPELIRLLSAGVWKVMELDIGNGT